MATVEGQTPPDCFNQPSQQSVVFECSVCAENYGPDFEHLSRSLRCGHTFCTKCLMKIMTSRGVKCPMCNLFHTLSSPDVTLLPINYAVQEILKNISTDDKLVDSQAEPECPPCGVCKLPASVICVDCMPGNHFHFCSKCDEEEHGRPFGPVQRHRRFPFDKAPGVSSLTTCVRHPGVSVLFYSESLNEFACNMCVAGDYWAANGSHFESVSLVTKKLQGKVQKFSKHTHDILKRLAMSKQSLEEILNNLEPAAINVKADITTRFSALIEALEERQKILLSNVDIELKNRRENVKTQLEVVVESVTKYRDAFESLNSLISKTDLEFLRLYSSVTQIVETLLESEDKGLIRPVINQTIPFYINKDTEKAVRSLGAVGGGLTPTDLEYSSTGSQGSLMELLWQLPEHCGKLSRFQIEYDQLMIERRDSGFLVGSESDPLVYTQGEPQLYEVAGNKLNTFVDYLCPGYSYQFRIRSANDAGWGMWSKPIVGKCESFPFTLNYTKSIHRVVIPTSGFYRITVKGAKAEDGMVHCGGKGAIISGIFSLKAGDVLILLCGGMSSRHHYHSGGGGGSFVAVNEITQSNLLIAAGGGGGTRGASMEDWDGSDASLTPDGKDGLGEDAGKGGINGGPGTDSKDSASEGPSFGNGGAGFVQNSSTAMSFLSGGHGGQNGGFGGGGAVGMYGGGGGGGYSGGGGGRGGGGGGSYICSAAVEVSKEVGNDTHGSIVIDKVMPPYPLPEQKLTQMVSDESKQADSNSEPSSSVHGLPLYSQSSSGTTGSLLTSLSSRAMSTGTSVGIPEGYFDSPVSTNQVMDQSKVPPAVVSFSVGPNVGSGDNSCHDLCGVRSDAVDLFEADSSGPQVNWRPAGGPALEEFFGSSQGLVTEASSVLVGNSNAATVPAAVRVTEVVTRTPSYALGTGVAPIDPSKVESKDLIEFQEEGVDSNPDLVRKRVSPEDVATILLQLSTADRVVPSQSQATVSLADNNNGNLDAVRVSKNVLGTTADHNLLSQQNYQEQINPSRSGLPVAVNPVQSTQAVSNPSALSSEQQAVALQLLLQSPQHLDSRELQQKLAELQRYLLAQQQQQMHQQLLVQPGGKEDLSPPLTQQHSDVPAPVTSQYPPGQPNQSALQPPIYPSNVYQQSQPVHSQQSPLMLVQGGGLTAPTVGTRDQTNQGNVSPPLGARQEQQPQQQQQQHQQHQNPAGAVAQDSQPGNGMGSDSVQYQQQPLYDFNSTPNWNSNH